MAYDPSSQRPGGQPPEDRPEEQETPEETPPGSTVPIPPASDYPQPSSAGAYTTPMSPSEYPSSQQGGMQPPPGGYGSSAEGSAPSQGGYTPPSQGGYSPGGGYSPPPPPPPMYSGPGMESAATPGEVGLQGLLQSYIKAVTKPNAGTYQAEIPNASWTRVLIGVAAVAVVGALVNLAFAGAMASNLNVDDIERQLREQGSNFDVSWLRWFAGGAGAGIGVGTALIGPFITFFAGSFLLFLMAKLFGGEGSDFMTHSYLLSLSYTPLRIAASILGIVPCVGAIAGIVLPLYQLYCAGLAMQASQRMAPSRAQLAAFLPAIVGIIFACLCVILFFGALIAAFSGSTNP